MIQTIVIVAIIFGIWIVLYTRRPKKVDELGHKISIFNHKPIHKWEVDVLGKFRAYRKCTICGKKQTAIPVSVNGEISEFYWNDY